jgi:hypothetical protein
LEKSQNKKQLNSFFSSELSIELYSSNNWWIVECFGRKLAPEKIAEPLQIIFNKSLRQGKYPSSWKIAHVIAIFKKGDASLPSNYRPISLISCVGKIMERVVYKNVYNYLVRNKLI